MAMIDLPSSFMQWAGLLALLVVGVFALIGIIDKSKRKNRNDADEAESRLIKALKDEVEVLTRKIDAQDAKIQNLVLRQAELKSENVTLMNVINGQDDGSKEYRKAALASMEKVEQIARISVENNDSIKKLYKAIEKHLGHMEEMEASTLNSSSK